MKRKAIAIMGLVIMLMTGCEEKIDIDLENANPLVVIEGWITDRPGPYRIEVTRTIPYFSDETPPAVAGATVVISDDVGNIDSLVEVSPGIYETTFIQGVQQRRYTCTVTADGNTYVASDKLNRLQAIDSLTYEFKTRTGFYDEGYYVSFHVTEPVGQGDFYQFKFYLNDSLFDGPEDYLFTDDRFVDGNYISFELPYAVEQGDTVSVEILAVSEATYDFLYTFFQELNTSGSPFGAPPANLKTNFTGGAVGYFGAYAVTADTIVVQ